MDGFEKICTATVGGALGGGGRMRSHPRTPPTYGSGASIESFCNGTYDMQIFSTVIAELCQNILHKRILFSKILAENVNFGSVVVIIDS